MKAIKYICKVLAAGVVSVAILSCIICFYYLVPLHHKNQSGNTDYVWTPNAIWIKMNEGISWGRFDSEGFNNPEVIEDPDIILLGSSHMEATNVFFEESTCGQLTNVFKDKYKVYNLGIQGHDFFKVCQYLPINLGKYENPPKFVIIETDSLEVTEEKLEQALNFEVEYTPSHDTGVVAFLQRIPFFRQGYQQMKLGLLDVFLSKREEESKMKGAAPAEEKSVDEFAYKRLFEWLSDLEKDYGSQIIIFYHPEETINADGSVSFERDESQGLFSDYANQMEIGFIDMTRSFEEMYSKDHKLPHGFITGEAGWGHLNANGHAAIASELYKLIMEMEAEGMSCK